MTLLHRCDAADGVRPQRLHYTVAQRAQTSFLYTLPNTDVWTDDPDPH